MTDLVHVDVDQSTCVGSGTCAGLAPDYFELDPAGLARPLQHEVADADELREAEDCCPVQAIMVQPAGQASS